MTTRRDKAYWYHFLFLAILVLVSIDNGQSQDVCSCDDYKAPRYYRYNQKHDIHFENYPSAVDPITPTEMIKWEKTYARVRTEIKTRPLDQPRVMSTPEESLYVLKGYMWFIKHEKHGTSRDCDFHIEIGSKTKSGKRVIVELPNDDCNYQQQILDHIKEQGYKLNEEFDRGLECEVSGLGFYDRVHGPAGHGRKGKTTFTSWELHPVKSIVFK